MLHSKLLNTECLCLPQNSYCLLLRFAVSRLRPRLSGSLWNLFLSPAPELALLTQHTSAPNCFQPSPYLNMPAWPHSSRIFFLTQINWLFPLGTFSVTRNRKSESFVTNRVLPREQWRHFSHSVKSMRLPSQAHLRLAQVLNTLQHSLGGTGANVEAGAGLSLAVATGWCAGKGSRWGG